jgi:hypothetical protein
LPGKHVRSLVVIVVFARRRGNAVNDYQKDALLDQILFTIIK